MAEHSTHRHLEITDTDGAVASADVESPADQSQPTHVSLRCDAGHVTPGRRADLVDAVLDLPEVRQTEHLQATVPLGDAESLHRLQDRTQAMTTRPAGSSALVDAELGTTEPNE
jgi:hypothetical protein